MGWDRIGIFCIVLGYALPAAADIVGGDEVKPKDPIQGSIAGLYEPSPDGKSGSLCTASILGKNTALTAAHCVHSNGPKPVLLFGRDLHSPETVKRTVTAVRVNPRWAKKQGIGMDQGDIAIVQFQGGLPSGYEPAQVMKAGTKLRKGEKAVLAGYGISNARTHAGAGVLRKTTVTIDNPRPGKNEMILDQTHGKGACHGDSGGPAYIRSQGKMILAGVTNRSHPGSAPDDCAHKVVYTKVDSYSRWIGKTEAELSSGKAKSPKSRQLAGRARSRVRKSVVRMHRPK